MRLPWVSALCAALAMPWTASAAAPNEDEIKTVTVGC